MSIFSDLRREQKEAVGLLSVGTFLEYFDLMLYIHMAMLLNDLFFPKTDAHASSLLVAFAFCSTYILRPLGALVFGWIGDNIGRKVTVVITTTLMAVSCFIMANLPTYSQVGIIAAYIVTICRIIQGMTSMGEMTGAQLYLSETITPPNSYPAVAMLTTMASLGGTMALVIGHLSVSVGFNWRYAFWFGALIAVVGGIARIRLRETRDFIDGKYRLAAALKKVGKDPVIVKNNPFYRQKVNKKTILYLLGLDCMWPVCFYFSYVHCASILKNTFHFTSEQLIYNNLIASLGILINNIIFVALSKKIHPLKISRVRLYICGFIMLSIPYYLNTIKTPFDILLLQFLFLFFVCDAAQSMSIFYKFFPVLKRFTYMSVIYALSRAFIYVVTSFGIIYIEKIVGHWGLILIMLPTVMVFYFGLNYFQKLEREGEPHSLNKHSNPEGALA